MLPRTVLLRKHLSSNTSRSESRRSSELSLQIRDVGPTPHYGWRLWKLGTCLTCPCLSPRVIPSTPEDYCYLVRHAMKQPWKLNWIKQCLFPLHERRVSDVESSTVALEMSLLCCWRTGGEGGCEVGVLWRRMACASSPSLYHTHQLHHLSVVDIYLHPGYRSMLEM